MPKKRARTRRVQHSSAASRKNIPVGVKIISILAYIGSGLMALFALFLLVSGLWLSSATSADTLKQLATSFGAIATEITSASVLTYTIIIAVICVLLAVINFFVGRGLWFGKQWARILVIIYAAIQVVSGLTVLTARPGSGIFSIVLYGVIGSYLAFSSKVKRFFA